MPVVPVKCEKSDHCVTDYVENDIDSFLKHTLSSTVCQCIEECKLENVNRFYETSFVVNSVESDVFCTKCLALCQKYYETIENKMGLSFFNAWLQDFCLSSAEPVLLFDRLTNTIRQQLRQPIRISLETLFNSAEMTKLCQIPISNAELMLFHLNALYHLAKTMENMSVFENVPLSDEQQQKVMALYNSRHIRNGFNRYIEIVRGHRRNNVPLPQNTRMEAGIMNVDTGKFVAANYKWLRNTPWKHPARDMCLVSPTTSYSKSVYQANIPLACGISGSTGLLLWDLLFFAPPFSEDDIRLFIWMVYVGLCLDGGHALQEVLADFLILTLFVNFFVNEPQLIFDDPRIIDEKSEAWQGVGAFLRDLYRDPSRSDMLKKCMQIDAGIWYDNEQMKCQQKHLNQQDYEYVYTLLTTHPADSPRWTKIAATIKKLKSHTKCENSDIRENYYYFLKPFEEQAWCAQILNKTMSDVREYLEKYCPGARKHRI